MFGSTKLCCPFLAAHLVCSVKVLLLGSTRSFNPGQEPPFQTASIVQYLNNFGDIELSDVDVYSSASLDILVGQGKSVWDNEAYYMYSLAQYMFWPVGKSERYQLLGGTSSLGTWDFVVIMHDPYILSRFPGYYAEGVKMVADKVKMGGATPLLFMQWPGPDSSVSNDTFADITYRVGAGAGVRVIPGGKVWQEHGSSNVGGHPSSNGAFIAAAAIYGEILNISPADKLSDTDHKVLADQAFTLVQQERCKSHVSGAFNLMTPFSMTEESNAGDIKMCHTGSSSERGIVNGLQRVASKCNGVSVSSGSCGTGLDFNLGRGNFNFEANKRYKVSAAQWPLSFGFPMQERADCIGRPYGLDHRMTPGNDLDICELMLGRDEVRQGARCVPIRLMYSKMLEEDPSVPSHKDDDNWHMSNQLDDASGSYIYTMASRQTCKEEMTLGQRIGCETAWRLATLAGVSGEDLSPSCPTTMTEPTTTTTTVTTTTTTTTEPTTTTTTTTEPTTTVTVTVTVTVTTTTTTTEPTTTTTEPTTTTTEPTTTMTTTTEPTTTTAEPTMTTTELTTTMPEPMTTTPERTPTPELTPYQNAADSCKALAICKRRFVKTGTRKRKFCRVCYKDNTRWRRKFNRKCGECCVAMQCPISLLVQLSEGEETSEDGQLSEEGQIRADGQLSEVEEIRDDGQVISEDEMEDEMVPMVGKMEVRPDGQLHTVNPSDQTKFAAHMKQVNEH